jgi:hypothetical protein
MYLNEILKKRQSRKNILNGESRVKCNACQIMYSQSEYSTHYNYCIRINNDEYMPKKYIHHTSRDKAYGDFLKDKRLVIVAPSKAVLETMQAEYIDSYDYVVRLNKSLPIPRHLQQFIGSRTDILYNNMNITDFPGENQLDMVFLKKHLQYLCCPYPEIHPFAVDINRFKYANRKSKIPFHCIDTKYYNKIVTGINTRMNTGIGAILDLLSYDIKELYITGFTFFMDGHYKEYRDAPLALIQSHVNNGSIHSQEPQITLLRKLVLDDNRITLDNTLEGILFTSYDLSYKRLCKYVSKHCFVDATGRIPKESFLDIISIQHQLDIVFASNMHINGRQLSVNNEYTNKILDITIINNNEVRIKIKDTDIECSLRLMEPHMYNVHVEYMYYLNGPYAKHVTNVMKKIGIINLSVEFFTLLFLTSMFPQHNIYCGELQTTLPEKYFYKYLIYRNKINSL